MTRVGAQGEVLAAVHGGPSSSSAAPPIILLSTVDHLPAIHTRWNTNNASSLRHEKTLQEVAQLLYSAVNHPEWLSDQVRQLPPSGSQLLFKRFDGNYYKVSL